MHKKILFLTLIAIGGVTTGCASKQVGCSTSNGECNPGPREQQYVDNDIGDDNLKIPAFSYKAIIGTRNDDAKTVVDTGVVLKVYISTYKDTKKTLVASHDRYVWAKEPGFIVGTERPDIRKRTGLMTSAGKVPFAFGAGEIDSASIQDNTRIKEYINAVSESTKRETSAISNMTEADEKFDQTIKDYVQKMKEEK